MITIRYADLPEGLHAQAEACGRRTIIYLRPGLTPEQRRDSLRRARQSARMGHGPRLTAAGVAVAVAADAVRCTLRNVAAAVRGHPLGSLLLAAGIAAAALCYVLLVTVSIRLIAPPFTGLVTTRPPHAVAPYGPGRGLAPWPPGGDGATSPGAGPGGPGQRVIGGVPSPRAHGPGPRPSPSGSTHPTPAPTRSPKPTRSPSPRPTRSRRPTPRPSPSPSGLCVLGICL